MYLDCIRLYEQQQETYLPFLVIFGTFSWKLSEINMKRWENFNSFYCIS